MVELRPIAKDAIAMYIGVRTRIYTASVNRVIRLVADSDLSDQRSPNQATQAHSVCADTSFNQVVVVDVDKTDQFKKTCVWKKPQEHEKLDVQ